MAARRVALGASLTLLLATHHHPIISAEPERVAPRAVSVPALPLLFESTPDGPVAHARGLEAAITRDGAAIRAGGRTILLEFMASGSGHVTLESPQPTRINRLQGARTEWRTNIPTFGRVRLPGVYPGVDAVFYGNDRQLEYDLELAPGASPDAIAVAFHGADRITIDADGQLLIAAGDRLIVQRPPFAYQDHDGHREQVHVRYALDQTHLRFVVGSYDRRRPLIIDPIISYSTYFGVEGSDYIDAVALDADGNVLIAGAADGGEFPTRSLRPRPTPAPAYAVRDPFVAKLAPDGTPIWLTFLGGSSDDLAADVAAGPGGVVFVAGTTSSIDFPVTAGAFDTTPNTLNGHYESDGFVARLSPDGTDLQYATFLGGTLRENIYVLALDAEGRAHVGGATESVDFPATAGGPSRAQGEIPDGFVTRLSADGASVEMSRLIAGNYSDVVRGLALDSVGEINVVGGTTSDVFPVVNAMRATKYEPGDPGGEVGWDGFVMRLTTDGEIRFSTYLGGMKEDYLTDIALGPDGTLYVAGETSSDSFPGTSTRRPNYNSDVHDLFVVRLADSGMQMLGGRYHGGTAGDGALDLAVDRLGLVWVTGTTRSSNYPAVGSFPLSPRGQYDIAVAQFSADLWEVHLSGAFGGSETELGYGVAIDRRGDAWFVGYSGSTNYPVMNPIQPAKKGAHSWLSDSVMTKLGCEVTNAGYTPHRTVGAAGSTGTITIAMDPGCALAPITTVGWLRVTEIGADRIHYVVDPNPAATSRTGWIMVEETWGHRVTQLGAAAPPAHATEIVLNADDATAVRGSWFFDTDGADEHFIIRQIDRGRPKIDRPEITPVHYFEMQFYAEAGRPYRLWLLGSAQPRHWANDSVHVQFSDSVTSAGAPIYRIGTRSSAEVNLEDCANCGVPAGFSWDDHGWGSPGALGLPIRFASTGMHTVRVQTREDGMSVGQIVLSAARYFTAPPPEGEWVTEPQQTERVLHARDAVRTGDAWQFVSDPSASRGERLWNPNAGAPKVTTPAATPQHYVEFTFNADAGRPYRIWLRLKAQGDHWANDSVWVQFSDTVDAAANAIARIGSTRGLDVNLEECSGCGLEGWGWRDNGWGSSPPPAGTLVYFASSGSHTLRVQTREDGVSLDQIVISADTYLHAPPGPAKRDNTIFD